MEEDNRPIERRFEIFQDIVYKRLDTQKELLAGVSQTQRLIVKLLEQTARNLEESHISESKKIQDQISHVHGEIVKLKENLGD